MSLESEALSQLALRCAAKSLSSQVSRVASRNPSRVPSRNPSRAVSRAVSRYPSMENISAQSPEWEDFTHHIRGDAFSRILEVTNQQEAVMAYYYMDENNEVNSVMITSNAYMI